MIQLTIIQLKDNLWEGTVAGIPESLVRAPTKDETKLKLKIAMLRFTADKLARKEWDEPESVWFSEI